MVSRTFRCIAGALLALVAIVLPAFAQCPSDLNADGRTDSTDLATTLAQWGNCASGSSCSADLNDDGIVEGKDLALLLSAWGDCPFVVPAWASLLNAHPSADVVHDHSLRAAIINTGYAWRVRHAATQIEMMLIPPGTFEMGCSASLSYPCDADEFPIRTVTLTQPFYIGRYEVTQAEWTARMGSNPSAFQSASAQVPASQVPRRPVETVSWNTIQGFLAATGLRLPTEAEWEYACRAGTTTAFHSMPGYPAGTNDDSLVGNIAWFEGNAQGQTWPVGQRAGNGLGLHDMSGNVGEWVADWYGPYPTSAQTDPTGPGFGNRRGGRGGSWFLNSPLRVRSSERSISTPGFAFYNRGFRVARNP